MDEKEFKFKLAAYKVRAALAEATSHQIGERNKDLIFGYEEVISKADLAQLKVVRAAMQVTLEDVQKDLDQIDALAAEVAELTKAKDVFVAHYDEVKQLTASVSETRRKATTRTLPLKAGMRAVDAGIAKLADGKSELLDAWAKIDATVRQRVKAVDDESARLVKIKAKALVARSAHAASELKALQNEAGGMGAMLESAFTQSLTQSMTDFSKRLAHNPDLAKTPELVRQKAETQKLIAGIVERTKANAKSRDEIRAVKVDPIDLAKAARELGGIAANLLPKLEKALAQDPTGMLKAIEGVLKEAGRSMSAKDAVTKLKKAKVI